MKPTKLGFLGKQGKLEPVNPSDGIWMIPGFGNTGVVETDDGLVLVDAPIPAMMDRCMSMLRSRLDAPVHSIYLTHGHGDHAVSLDLIYDEAERNRQPMPRTIAQRNMIRRFNRYRMLEGYHEHINRLQFAMMGDRPVFPIPKRNPDITFDHSLALQVGGLLFEAYHARGETDDHLWVWVPQKKTVFTGDMVVSSFPNVGNPFKVQRFTLEWAQGLEAIAGKNPDLLIPGHGAIIQGSEAIQETCLTTAAALRYLHDEVVRRLNAGMWYEDILHDITLPDKYSRPAFLKPMYGRPEFVIHGILREYTGWYDGNPSNLFPPKKEEIHRELASLVGQDRIVDHALELQSQGRYDMALQFVDIALCTGGSSAGKADLHRLKADLLKTVGERDTSLISRNIYHNGYKQEMALADPGDGIN